MNLYTKESGSGQPMVLLHGNGEDSSYFVNQISFFESKYLVIAVDTRGHGRSPRGRGTFTLERFADDLKGFLDRRGLRRIILLGFSDGGNIALIFALKYPGYVDRLILNGANLNPFGMKPPCWRMWRGSMWELWGALAAEKRHRADTGKNADGSRKKCGQKSIFKRKRKTEWTGRTE